MLYREIIAVCSQIHTKHINTLWTKCRGVGWIELIRNRKKWSTFCEHGNEPSGMGTIPPPR